MIPGFKDIDVRELIPQKDPFVLVDQLVSWNEAETRTRYTVPDNGIMVRNGRLCAAGLVEVMAQTSAAHIGYINKYILLRPVSMGYIGAVRRLSVYREPRVGETIEATLRIEAEAGPLTRIGVLLSVRNEAVAWGELTVALQQ